MVELPIRGGAIREECDFCGRVGHASSRCAKRARIEKQEGGGKLVGAAAAAEVAAAAEFQRSVSEWRQARREEWAEEARKGGRSKLVLTCSLGACCGLLFGYDLGITGGVADMDGFLRLFFPSVLADQRSEGSETDQYCKFNSGELSMFTSSLFVAALFSSLGAGRFTDNYGGKMAMTAAITI